MQDEARRMADLHQLNIASGKGVMRGDLLRRRIDGSNMVAIMVFDNVEVLQYRACDRARTIPIADMDRLHIWGAFEFDSMQDFPQFRDQSEPSILTQARYNS